jgi:hypothetical protein
MHPPLPQTNLLSPTAKQRKQQCPKSAHPSDEQVCQAEYKWKEDFDEIKKDKTKDLHPSIKMMIKNASTIERNKAGKLGETFLSLYNSKTHGGPDTQLHQLFHDTGMGAIVYAEGVSTNMWAGNFTRVQKMASGPSPPFSFSEKTAISGNNEKDSSLLLEIYSTIYLGLIKSIDDVKLWP